MHTTKAVKYIPHLFESFVSALAPVDYLGIDADIVIIEMAKENLNADVMCGGCSGYLPGEEAEGKFVAVFGP